MILIRLVLLPPKMAFGTTRLTWKTVRVIGMRRLFWVSVGVGIGLLVAPVPGEQIRERLRRKIDELQGDWADNPEVARAFQQYPAAEAPVPVTAQSTTGNGLGSDHPS